MRFLVNKFYQKCGMKITLGSDRVVDDTLRRLRKKMPEINIRTIYGFGYRLD